LPVPSNFEYDVRCAIARDVPPVPVAAIHRRAEALATRAQNRRATSTAAVVATMLFITILGFFMIDRAFFVAPVSAVAGARAPMPSPTVT
jgi:hypothetical protein